MPERATTSTYRARRTDYRVWGETLKIAVGRVQNYDPDVLIISLGVDTFAEDPVSGFMLWSVDYFAIGAQIKTMKGPPIS